MRLTRIADDDRAASIAITHALTLAISAILVTSLLAATGNFLTTQQDRVAQSQLQDVGGDLATVIERADRVNATGEAVNATFEPDYPAQVAGEPYTIALVTDPGDPTSATLYVNSSDLGQSVAIDVETATPMVDSRARGENPTVSLCTDASGRHRIALRGCP